MKRLISVAALGLCLAGCQSASVPPRASSEPAAAARGRLAAERDISEGSLILQTYGIAASGSRYGEFLRERLGVQTQVAADVSSIRT